MVRNKVTLYLATISFFFLGLHDWFVNLFIDETAPFTLA